MTGEIFNWFHLWVECILCLQCECLLNFNVCDQQTLCALPKAHCVLTFQRVVVQGRWQLISDCWGQESTSARGGRLPQGEHHGRQSKSSRYASAEVNFNHSGRIYWVKLVLYTNNLSCYVCALVLSFCDFYLFFG